MKRPAPGPADRTGKWRLRLDGTACDGHAICALHCPDLITLDEWGFAGVGGDIIETRPILRRARRAVAACPEAALSLRRVDEGARSEQRAVGAARGTARVSAEAESVS